ncbi:MAG: type I methionyl aminopeptidase [Thermomicrobiales bacterium]
MAITIKNAHEIELMRQAGFVVAKVHARIQELVAPGVTTGELDDVAREIIDAEGAISNFYGHHGFTGRICASINDEIVHGIPGERSLKEGDIISIDVGAIVGGFHGDSAWTYPVGQIPRQAADLLTVTEASLYEGIAKARAGNHLGAIGHAVEEYATSRGYGLVREYGGHGIGRQMWEDPHIPNHGSPDRGIVLRQGMTIAIEPMLTTGGDETRTLEDGWTVITADGSLAAHFEHTVVVTENEPEILTKRLSSVVK